MTRNRILAMLLLVALGWNIALAASFAVHLPIVANGAPVATRCDASAPLLDQDTGSLSAALTADGRYVLAYQDREHGSRAHIVQHVGDHLVEIAAPVAGDSLVGPAFSPPGVKQGSLALVAGPPGQRNRLYFTQRVEDEDPAVGPYALWCMEF